MKKLSALLALLLCFVLALSSCGTKETVGTTVPATEPETALSTTAEVTEATTAVATTAEATTVAETTAPEPPKYVVKLTEFEGPVSIHTEKQAAYLADANPHSILTYSDNYDAAKEESKAELSRPNPITLSWEIETELSENDLSSFTVRLWTKSDASDLIEFGVGKSLRTYSFYNAFIGTTYYWNVSAVDAEGTVYTSETSTFETEAQAPRNLYVDSVTNVRDLGGWQTEDGGRVRQGLLYRGAKFSENFSTTPIISSAGIRTMTRGIGIKIELDLRQTQAISNRNESGGLTASPLGDSVQYLAYPMEYGTVLITDSRNVERIRQIFALLADESNYPIYFHCSIGTDRTGLIAWLVNALCGVSEEDLWRDYLFSNFGMINAERTRAKNEDVYVNQIKAAPGETLAEKTYNFLKDTIGVSESDMQSVIRIMKEAPNAD